MRLTLDQAMRIHQRAIDKTVDAGEGAAWWALAGAASELPAGAAKAPCDNPGHRTELDRKT